MARLHRREVWAERWGGQAQVAERGRWECEDCEYIQDQYLMELYDQGNSEAGQYAASIEMTMAQVKGKDHR